jgi:hypothetical protein
LRKPQGGRELAGLHRSLTFTPHTFTVSEILLFKSELLPKGAQHTALFRHRLRTDAE